MSIRARLAVGFTLVMLVLTVSGSVLFVSQLQKALLSSVHSRLSDRLAVLLTEAADRGGRIHPLLGSNGIYAQVLDPGAAVLTTTRGTDRAPFLTPAQLARIGDRTVSFDGHLQVHAGARVVRTAMRLRATTLPRSGDFLVVATSEADVDTAARRAAIQLIVLCAGMLVVALVGGWWLTRAALRPVERMRRQVARLGVDRLASGIAVPRSRDEIALLGHTFNDLLRRVSDAADRERAFVSDAGHELRTPLAILKGELELAQNPKRTREELLGTVGVAAEETDRLIALAEDLLFLARGDESPAVPLEPADLVAIVDEAVRSVAVMAQSRSVRLAVAAPPQLWSDVDRDRIRRAVDNVLVNALHAVAEGGSVRVDLAAVSGEAVLRVTDDGPGFPPEFVPHAFERFSRVPDPAVPGNGLGLAIVRSVMTGHGGTATVENATGGGAVITLRWPLTSSPREGN
ncbi:MAG: HAMP domain-containing histidine kinase [Jatrophihabitans sp.]|nr:MAG: HAMP domain-containing histidine kinase [Jatrophihabitans sp.]